MSSRVIFDIETLAQPLESFDDVSKHYLTRFADTDEKMEDVRKNLNLHALTARILAIALLNPDSGHGRVLFESDTADDYTSSDGLVHFSSCTEKEMLEEFWKIIPSYDEFITFNGRGFDCPFLMTRSGMLGVRVTRNLMLNRYDRQHCDLLEQLTFYGATRRFSLDFYCKSFGFESPKSKGITGLDMKELVEQKRFRDIAEYCYGDVVATGELHNRWNEFINTAQRA
ncbi:MAG: ribonuclease H-like domain-containing protein [Ignavibacteriales bacterium]|nr:ribonuclease H-like domain-containing protein [Ignavibacteriales bacterium]